MLFHILFDGLLHITYVSICSTLTYFRGDNFSRAEPVNCENSFSKLLNQFHEYTGVTVLTFTVFLL